MKNFCLSVLSLGYYDNGYLRSGPHCKCGKCGKRDISVNGNVNCIWVPPLTALDHKALIRTNCGAHVFRKDIQTICFGKYYYIILRSINIYIFY